MFRAEINNPAIYDRIEQARIQHNGLIKHADAWFNLKDDASFKLKIPESVKWQLLHAASANESDLGYHFGFKHLNQNDLVLLFRILNSYSEYQKKNGVSIYQAHVQAIFKFIRESCQKDAKNSKIFIELFLAQDDSNLDCYIKNLKLISSRQAGHVPSKNGLMAYNERLMLSGISTSYQRQIQSFINTKLAGYVAIKEAVERGNQDHNPLVNAVIKYVRHLQTPIKDEYGAKIEYHRTAVQLHREILNFVHSVKSDKTPLLKEIHSFINEYELFRIQEIDLREDYIDFMYNDAEVELPSLSKESRKDVVESLKGAYEHLAQKNGRFVGHPDSLESEKYDASYTGDQPHYLFKIGNTRIIRTPNINIETKRNYNRKLVEAKIAPEFIAYLEALKNKGEKHLYFNLMSMQNHFEESLLTQNLHFLDKDPNLGGVFMCVSFDKNSPFYHQNKQFTSYKNLEQFKALFKEELFNERSFFYWSKHINIQEWKREASQIIEQVHDQYYKGVKELDSLGRQDFIELTYIKFEEALIKKLQPVTANVSCRCCIDRGGAALTKLYINRLISLNKPFTRRKIQKITSLAFAPAIMQLNRRMLSDRAEGLFRVSERMLSNTSNK